MCVVLFAKMNSMQICEEIQKNAVVRFRANFYLKKLRGYPHISLRIPEAFAKIYFFRVILIWCTFVFSTM